MVLDWSSSELCDGNTRYRCGSWYAHLNYLLSRWHSSEQTLLNKLSASSCQASNQPAAQLAFLPTRMKKIMFVSIQRYKVNLFAMSCPVPNFVPKNLLVTVNYYNYFDKVYLPKDLWNCECIKFHSLLSCSIIVQQAVASCTVRAMMAVLYTTPCPVHFLISFLVSCTLDFSS